MKRYTAFLFSALLSAIGLVPLMSLSLLAQEQTVFKRGLTTLENTFPPSPEPASLVRYVDVPFSHSQGLSLYEVPFYNLKGRELSIPISLSYSSGGIKLDEISGVAGLGWTLNVGGVITRTVVDMPDEFNSIELRHVMPSSTMLSKLESQTNDTDTYNYLRDIVWHRIDASLDRYSYNVCGLSGSFVIDDDGQVIQLSGDGVNISYAPGLNGADNFIITGPDGTTFTFDVKETGVHDGSADHPFTPTSGEPDRWEATTAWYLSSIKSRSGLETATFTYGQSGQWIRNILTRQELLNISTDNAGRETWSCDLQSHFIASSYTVPVLTCIELSGFTVSFSYSQDTGNCLHYVANGTSVQNFPFRLTGVSVSYSGTPLVTLAVGTARDTYDGRIILNNLRQYKGGTLDDRWDFTYATRDSTVSRYSQDWFGFYNGEDDASPHSRGGVCPFELNLDQFELSRGYPDAEKASYMSLLTADHDGAKTVYTYEGNTLGVNGGSISSVNIGVRVKQIDVYDGSTAVQKRSFSYEEAMADGPVVPVVSMYVSTSVSQTSIINSNETISQNHNWSFSMSEHPVIQGPSLYDSRIVYGLVTEDVAAAPLVRPRASGLVNIPFARTVRRFRTADAVHGSTNTISRFPSFWLNAYTSSNYSPSSFDPMQGVRSEYVDAGPASPALLTSVDEYTQPSLGEFRHLSHTEYTYDNGSRSCVLTDYVATKVMQRMQLGNLQYQDIYHYPVYTTSFSGRHPVSERHVTYHTDGTSDEYFITTVYVPRTDLSRPVRIQSVIMTEGGCSREAKHIYPDTWEGSSPSWVNSLKNFHALTDVLKSEYRVWQGNLRPQKATRSIERNYAIFSTTGSNVPFLKSNKEFMAGIESWSEEVNSRDVYGNVSSVTETGMPETKVVWLYR